jgi:hypothetical protein
LVQTRTLTGSSAGRSVRPSPFAESANAHLARPITRRTPRRAILAYLIQVIVILYDNWR